MSTAKDILSPEDYKNYRKVRAVAVLFIVFGSVLLLGGIVLAVGGDPPIRTNRCLQPWASVWRS